MFSVSQTLPVIGKVYLTCSKKLKITKTAIQKNAKPRKVWELATKTLEKEGRKEVGDGRM